MRHDHNGDSRNVTLSMEKLLIRFFVFHVSIKVSQHKSMQGDGGGEKTDRQSEFMSSQPNINLVALFWD